MISSIFNEKVSVYRRTSAGVDSLGNPTYGEPVTGVGWSLVYECVLVRLAFTDKRIEFSKGAERVLPHGTMYFPAEFDIKHEDRIITAANIQYVVTSLRIGYKTGTSIDHMEAILELP